MNLTKIYFVLILFSGFFSFGFQSQDKKPLIDVIAEIETKFDVKFSYSVTDMDQVFVEAFKDSESLQFIIDKLNASTNLNFKLLNERYITILPSKKLFRCAVF
ncbi:hypothetical protein JCM19274_424 [Algibacter lectus]|uniref:Protein FecR C-terminal domain-containing protein n=1 Tax=Algibacter lectus TaxID=221126 RepID=A0A090X151_9FLAO|nr:FecR domain-containing protein [Algibacter lectus]GAL81579.1 hypothetical protein JCM19274_424 [Algibacter lectus]